ncbi:unnamed protein product (mitochondrion) [Plasmodiophora brassicae]|uniref:RCC1-like domain-containing protein n=1 Tax=Plasmodiophora brassicae TaxID=37360 RepID=A0A3P3YJ93_PLABS|nr:unnamed protein product [Plasmodiophora brassicae]
MCVTHRGASGAPRSSKPKRSSQPAAAPADKGDDRRDDDDDDKRSKTTRPRTVRYLSQTRVDAEMSLATDTRRLSADDSDSALAKFLAEQRQAQAPRVPTLVRKQQDRLSALLLGRSTPEQLEQRNIYVGAQQRPSLHTRIESLNAMLMNRPERHLLVSQHILVDGQQRGRADDSEDALDGNGAAAAQHLSRLLAKRPTQEELLKRNILRSAPAAGLARFSAVATSDAPPDEDTTTTTAAGAAAAATAGKAPPDSPQQRLERMLASRPSPATLVQRNILQQAASPTMHAHRKRLERHAKTSSLEQLLGTRPSRESLRQFGIIAEDDDKIAEEEATTPFVLSPLNITPDLILPAAAASTLPAPDTTCVVFLWGQGHHGQLGLDNTRSQPFPQLVRSLLGVRVAQVALGAQHSLCVTSDGLAYGWGSNQHGQLGLGPDLALVKSPETLHVSRSPICNTTVQRVAAGAAHSAIVTGARRVLVMGRGQTPAQDDLLTFPAAVKPLADVDVDAVACGRQHSLAVTSSGDLWVWGRADEGQLGLGADVMRAGAWVPPTPMTSHGEFWASVQCGPDHCCAIGFDGAVYAWGDNTFGQCGLASPTTTSVAAPTPVRSLQRKGVTSVSCGPHHTVALTDDGTIYSTRIGQHGQGFQRIPPAHCFTGVAATLTNTIGVTQSGMIYSWQVGGGASPAEEDHGDASATRPGRLTTLKGMNLSGVVAGYRHMAILATVSVQETAALVDQGPSAHQVDGHDDQAGDSEAPGDDADPANGSRPAAPLIRRGSRKKRQATMVDIDPSLRSVAQDD